MLRPTQCSALFGDTFVIIFYLIKINVSKLSKYVSFITYLDVLFCEDVLFQGLEITS